MEIVELNVSKKKINTKNHELLELETILETIGFAHFLLRGGSEG